MKPYQPESALLKFVLRPVLIGTLVGAVTCLVVLILLAGIAASVDIPPAIVVPLATCATAVASFTGSFAAAKIVGKNGWLIGLIVSILLFIFSMIAGFSLFSSIDGSFVIIKFAIMLATGVLGGILAVNSGKRR